MSHSLSGTDLFAYLGELYGIQGTKLLALLMTQDQQLEPDLEKVASERRPWTEAWEQAWEAYQGQHKPGGDETSASLRNRAERENDARYLGEKYFQEVCEYLPKGQCPPIG
jgi:hypothetical protein